MLIEFRIKNLKSFRDETGLLMTKVKSFKEHENDNIIKINKGFDLLKTTAIYGANGAGKSNFTAAMGFMIRIIQTSYGDSLKKPEERYNTFFQYILDIISEDAPTTFEVSFIKNDIIYRYGFEITRYGEIKKEWLFQKVKREKRLFERIGSDFIINKDAFKEGDRLKNDVNSNVLFISHLAQNNQPISKLILEWFSSVNVLSGLFDYTHQEYTATLLKHDKDFKKWATLAVRYLQISNIEVGEKDGQILAYHNRYDENNLLVDTVGFPVSTMESEGTKKLINMLGPIYDTLKNGRILFMDEFDARLHPNLLHRFLELFHKFNKNGGQFIFTAHDTAILTKEMFRRDQIWLVEKDQFGASKIYSLSDFNAETVRNTSAFDKKYLENEFGAADTMEIKKELIEILYDKKG